MTSMDISKGNQTVSRVLAFSSTSSSSGSSGSSRSSLLTTLQTVLMSSSAGATSSSSMATTFNANISTTMATINTFDEEILNTADDLTTTPFGATVMPHDLGSASTGFIIWAAALVFFMTPGLALFYSGLSKYNSALSLMMLCMMSTAVVSVQWFLFGFSLALSETGGQFIGDLNLGALDTLEARSFPNAAPQIPAIAFMLYQMQFAGITAGIVFGSVPERTRFLPAMVFVFFWTTFVYDFVAYWTWSDHGFLQNLSCLGEASWPCRKGSLDFAGGGPVHITAGFSGLAYLVVLGKRKLIHAEHHNMVNVMFGTGVLWFGWFAFNGGSAGGANTRAAMAATVTTISAATGGLTWVWFDYYFTRKLSAFSFCSGIVAGLVGITPGSGFVAPWASILIGFITAILCNLCCRLKKRLGIDDSFDAGSLHGAGGFIGNILTGIFAQKWVAQLDGTDIIGGLVEGVWKQIVYQIVSSAAIAIWAFLISFSLLWVINKIPGLHLRQSEADEARGGDLAEMGEAGYILAAPDTTPKPITTFAALQERTANVNGNAVHPKGKSFFDDD
ncbi:Ammonium transporter 1 [Hypsibius exemplaris]|uniref:Ammonium transporter n=1 Tax=Hypsibius exemplaris TaxID=2072580 RepID=A0A1W0X8X2_HYPEX|nr:Ammonium transporter 1 [Hypsibius exemplaris]